jgi:hypothetical protein
VFANAAVLAPERVLYVALSAAAAEHDDYHSARSDVSDGR